MKQLLLIGLVVLLGLSGHAQTARQTDFDYTGYGQMIYWKALNTDEKKVFLHAYLYRTHEITQEMKAHRKLKASASRYEDDIAAPVYNIFRKLEDNDKIELIKWIDIFYQQEFNRNESFNKALRYAFRKLQNGDKTMRDVYKRTYPQ